MPESDQPLLAISVKVLPQPLKHWAITAAVTNFGIEADEMYIAIVEGIIILCARGDSAGFTLCRRREDIEVCETAAIRIGSIGFVIAYGWPDHSAAEHIRIRVEHRCLIFLIGAGVIRVVAEHQPEVGVV